jgi:Cu/Ag efflux protein CusF
MKIDQAASKITIQHRQGGTVGTAANAKLLTDEYQIGQGLAVTGFKAGDQITYTEARVGGTWTVTKINKQ